MHRDKVIYLEIEFEVGDYIRTIENNYTAIIIYKNLVDHAENRKYKYTVIDNSYNKRTYYGDEIVKLNKLIDDDISKKVKNNIKSFNKHTSQ